MKAAIFDTETTALIQNSAQALDKQPRIIEFSGVLVENDGTVLEEIDFLCNPGITLDPVITKITGLTNADLKATKPFKDRIDEVRAFFLKADAVVAHNLHYDFSLVNFEFERAKFGIVWPPIKICTVEATEYLKGYRLSLTVLHELLFDEPFAGAHRAKHDVTALKKCYLELLKRGVI